MSRSSKKYETYEGIADVGDAEAGGIDVEATNENGSTQSSSSFRIAYLPSDGDAVIRADDGDLGCVVATGALERDTYCVVLEPSGAPILPVDPDLVVVAGPVAFGLENGFSIGTSYSLQWDLNRRELQGVDSTTIQVYSFSEADRTWFPVGTSSDPRVSLIEADAVSEGLYAVFGRRSADAVPPGTISDLTAVALSTGRAVRLVWTAPGNDGMLGTAARYRVLYNTQPITVDNLESSPRLP